MGVPTISSTSPIASQTGVYKNKVITVTFSEALLSSTVNAGTFILKNLDSNEVVPCSLSLSGSIVSITPIRHLIANTSYKLTIVGADTAVGTPIESLASSDSLATTVTRTFTTGDEIQVLGPEKTDTQKAAEGELDLPSNWTISDPTSEFYIVGSDPNNLEFGVEPSLNAFHIVFSDNLDTSTVNSTNIQITQSAYYEEDEEWLAYPDTSDGAANFQWSEPDDAAGVDMDFSDLLGTLSASGTLVTWTPDSSREFPRNTKIKAILTTGLTSAGGTPLRANYSITFYIKPFPYAVTPERVRDEVAPYVFPNWTDDLIGKTIYKNSIEALEFVRHKYNFTKRNHLFAAYVLHKTIYDMFAIERIAQDQLAGQFKRLGDMAVRYDYRMTDSMPIKMKEAKERSDKAKRALVGRWRTVMSFVKARRHPGQRKLWRNRKWMSDAISALEGTYMGRETAGNTRAQRITKVPGISDRW